MFDTLANNKSNVLLFRGLNRVFHLKFFPFTELFFKSECRFNLWTTLPTKQLFAFNITCVFFTLQRDPSRSLFLFCRQFSRIICFTTLYKVYYPSMW